MSKTAVYMLHSCRSRCPSLLNVWFNSWSHQHIVSIRLLNLRANHLVSPSCAINSVRRVSNGKWRYSFSNINENKKESIAKSDIDQKSRSDAELADNAEDSSASEKLTNVENPGILQRFREAYKQYGKILVCVHVVTSALWISGFYYAAVRYFIVI